MSVEEFGFGVIFLSLLASASLYFLPGIIAARRDHPNWVSIFLLDLFLGWTAIGWVVSLVWACSAIQKNEPIARQREEKEWLKPKETHVEQPKSDVKDCPFCGEEIKAKAIICKHCKSDLKEVEA